MYKYVNKIKLLSLTIISFMMIIIFFVSCKQEKTGTIHAQDNIKPPASKKIFNNTGRTIIVYYFHTTYRCYSCTLIEKLTKETLNSQFKKQINSSKIIFKTVNIEVPKNKHYAKDYELFTKTVVLVDIVKGKQVNWKRLDKTWDYLRDKDAFHRYIKDEVNTFIKGP
ncbi:nitrophenyl compound nitroreductase subunit ArsF family protein [Spirochaetota bacterium]